MFLKHLSIRILIQYSYVYELGIFGMKNHRLVNSDLDPRFIALVSGRMIVGLILYAIAIATSYLNTQVNLILFALIPIYYLVPLQYFWF
jgi:hypothetical protein